MSKFRMRFELEVQLRYIQYYYNLSFPPLSTFHHNYLMGLRIELTGTAYIYRYFANVWFQHYEDGYFGDFLQPQCLTPPSTSSATPWAMNLIIHIQVLRIYMLKDINSSSVIGRWPSPPLDFSVAIDHDWPAPGTFRAKSS